MRAVAVAPGGAAGPVRLEKPIPASAHDEQGVCPIARRYFAFLGFRFSLFLGLLSPIGHLLIQRVADRRGKDLIIGSASPLYVPVSISVQQDF